MSDTDRLRAAADALAAQRRQEDGFTDGPECPCVYCQRDYRTVALLRAVADLPGWEHTVDGAQVRVNTAALALADTILRA